MIDYYLYLYIDISKYIIYYIYYIYNNKIIFKNTPSRKKYLQMQPRQLEWHY